MKSIDLETLAADLRANGFHTTRNDTRARKELEIDARIGLFIHENGHLQCTGGTIAPETWRALDVIRRHLTEAGR